MSSAALRAGPAPIHKWVGGVVSVVKSTTNEAGKKVYTFLATTESVDRDGEIITLDGWDFSSFDANPVILDGHDYWGGCKAVVGRAVGPLRRVERGWEVDVEFAPTEEGKRVEALVGGGFIKAVSVGFISKKIERVKGEPPKHVEKELLEISVVPIPSNRDALRAASFAGSLPVGPADLRALFASRSAERPTPEKAMDFNQSMAQTDLSERRWEMYHALYQALDSILEDQEMAHAAKIDMAEKTCEQFHGAMMTVFKAALGPAPEGEHDEPETHSTEPDQAKTLETQIADLKAAVEALQAKMAAPATPEAPAAASPPADPPTGETQTRSADPEQVSPSGDSPDGNPGTGEAPGEALTLNVDVDALKAFVRGRN